MWFVQATPWLHRDDGVPRPAPPPLRQDWLAARILPFIVFMIVSTLTAALFFHPELGYPWKAAAMAAALVFFLPALRGRDWAPSLPALVAGALVGAGWLALAPTDDMDAFVLGQLLTGLGSTGLAVWIAARLLGTVVLVPVIEELFFRGYVLARLDRGGLVWRGVALAVSSGLFGLLHGRWLEAAAAGLVFGLMMLWRGRLADAVWAHVAANAVVAAVALTRGDWALI
jgi:exosortase E/protease (VPEID-CTERM system)